MRKVILCFPLMLSGLLGTPAACGSDNPVSQWPSWRGPLGTGVAPTANPPTEWSEDKNIKWKKPLPGSGYASPVVWGDRLFVLLAVDSEEAENPPADQEPEGSGRGGRGGPAALTEFDYRVLALDRKTGQTIWERTAKREVPHEGIHRTGSWASPSPITDGEQVYAFFGSRGVFCFDMEGRVKWDKDLGDMTIKRGFGEGASPALFGDTLVVNWDHEGDSFIVALDKNTGSEKWKVPRDEGTSWATPLIVEVAGKPQVVVNATNRIRAYDLADGSLIWECGGMTQNVIPTPAHRNGLAYIMSGFRGSALFAVDLASARGDLTDTDTIRWKRDKDTPYVSSPLLYEDHLYFHKGNENLLTCLHADTGEEFFSQQRLEGLGDIYASPTGAGDRVYVVARDGTALVLRKGPRYEVLATNRLEDGFSATPAIVGNEIYLRGHHALYCISEGG
ncbi:MAG: Outer membrane protein assembly factor BamB [bacterium]|nr:Outer membrane protein assembly factor BamB [bacterium]